VKRPDIRAQAERLVAGPANRRALVLAFDDSTASSAEVLVEGASFYPRMLADIAAASSSVHINQFGFRPGNVGDRFADALIAKAAEGVSVRLVVDRQGSDPEGTSQAFYDRLTAAGIEVCVVRATRVRVPAGPLAKGGATHWNLGGLGHIDHRKLLVVDGRVGWVGGAGIEDHFQDGRFHDLFLRVEGPVVAQLQLSSWRAFAGSAAKSTVPSSMCCFRSWVGAPIRCPPAFCTTRPAATGPSRTPSRACSKTPSRRWTS
jgi:phosphatidylserine/phosphatidylglycerophosphate/cardiolipin synthase-like enzyme